MRNEDGNGKRGTWRTRGRVDGGDTGLLKVEWPRGEREEEDRERT